MRRIASTPASCPRRRDSPRRVAHLPLPSMMMPTCSLVLKLLCIAKLPFKKKPEEKSGRQDAEAGKRGAFLPRGLCGIAPQPLQHGEIVEKAAAAVLGQ